MPTELKKLARYYGDVLTALAENSGRVLRDLSLGRGYGLVADLSPLNPVGNELLHCPTIQFDKIIPDLASDDEFTSEPENYTSLSDTHDSEATAPNQTEGNALVWRKQKQDTYNRETLLGYGLLRGLPSAQRKVFGPLICKVEKSVWRSLVDEPKRPKSKAAIPVIAQLKLLLDGHWERCGRPRTGFIFSNEFGLPMNLETLATNAIRPALEKASLKWHGWHAFRRGLATNLHRLGVSDKVIQQILRHANVTTTMNIYVKTVSIDAANTMKNLEAMCATTVQPERFGSTRIM